MTTTAGYPFGFMDESAKKEIRRSVLKAIALPGYQVPYSSREMPMGRGFGTGGLQLTLSVLDLPPASWVFAWNEQIKSAWVASPELEPRSVMRRKHRWRVSSDACV